MGTEDALSVISQEFLSLVPGFFAANVDESVRSLESLLRMGFPQEPTAEELYLMLGYNVSVPPFVRQALFSRSVDNDDVLALVRKPVLLTHGADDAIVKPDIVDRHKARLSHAQMRHHGEHWTRAILGSGEQLQSPAPRFRRKRVGASVRRQIEALTKGRRRDAPP